MCRDGFIGDIKTGLNEAFVIDEATRKRLVSEDPKGEELIKPWLRGRDIKKWKAEWAGLYVINIPSSAIMACGLMKDSIQAIKEYSGDLFREDLEPKKSEREDKRGATPRTLQVGIEVNCIS